MKDLHTHIIYGIDDGSKSLEESEKILEQASQNSVTDIMMTPHYIVDSKYCSKVKDNKKIYNELKKIAKEKYKINLYLGNEVFINNDILKLIKNREISKLNDGKYLLIELPMYHKINNIKSIMFELLNEGITPILAHPERYKKYYKDYKFFKELSNIGVLFQLNYVSLLGEYGRSAKYMAKKLLKLDIISFVGSDIHHSSEDKYKKIDKVRKKISKIIGKERTREIFEINFDKVINKENIKCPKYEI